MYASLFIADFDYDFAYCLAVDEDVEGIDVVFEGEFLRDEGSEFSCGVEFEEVFRVLDVHFGFATSEISPEHSDELAAFE